VFDHHMQHRVRTSVREQIRALHIVTDQ
jgi:hypothetical protein